MSTDAAMRWPGLTVIARWTCALVALGLLAVALLSLPFQLYAVRTGSMEPTFGPRALLLVHKNALVLGQPISFTHNGEVITHRLVSINADHTLVTRGDANETPDPWVVQRSDTIGGVIASMPQMGYWLVYLKTPTGLASTLLAIVAICLLWPIARELDDGRARGSTVKHEAPDAVPIALEGPCGG